MTDQINLGKVTAYICNISGGERSINVAESNATTSSYIYADISSKKGEKGAVGSFRSGLAFWAPVFCGEIPWPGIAPGWVEPLAAPESNREVGRIHDPSGVGRVGLNTLGFYNDDVRETRSWGMSL